jgi:LPS export ABC transporter protein LptC/lipopolysaccharide transport protein LptA
VATPGFGQKETRRKKWITGAVVGALGLTALTVGVAYWVGRVRKEQSLFVPPSLPSNVHQQLSGYTFTRSDEGRRIFTVRAARTVAFKDGGTTVLEDVRVELFGRSGSRHDILRTRRCNYSTQSGDLFSSGTVEIELNAPAEEVPSGRTQSKQPVFLETSEVAFRQQGSLVETEAPVRFRIGEVSGTARGMAYATKESWVELKKDVQMELRPKSGTVPQPPLRLAASRIRYDKVSREISLEGPLDIRQGARRVVAGRGVAFLDEGDRITRATLEGGVKGSDSSGAGTIELRAQRARGDFDPATGQLSRLVAEVDVVGESRKPGSASGLTAQRLELSLAGPHAKPRRGEASGNVQLTLESTAAPAPGSAAGNQVSPERKNLSAAQLNFEFRPDGRSVREAETVGAGTLVVVPPDPKAGERVITAGQFLMAFDARSRLEDLRGLSPTRIVFRPPAHAPPGSVVQESSADRLEATFDTATQALRESQQSGHFEFRDGDRQASAQEALYVAATQILTLTGHPQVWDTESRVKCERIDLNLPNGVADGKGKVQATHLPAEGQREHGRRGEPTNVLADRVVAERRSQVMHYEGHVRAWQGADVVESSALDVYRTQRRVSSGSQVLTSHLQPASLVAGKATSSQGPQRETRPVRVRADRLEYFDEGRKATYRGNVRLQTEGTTLEANGVDVYFSPAGTAEKAEIERAVAEGHVRVVQPGRRAQGEHAEYFAAPGKIVLTGGPPSLYDVEKGFTTGQRLTFFTHDDRLFVDGGDGIPSLSKHRVAQ